MRANSLEKRRTSIVALLFFCWLAVVAWQLFKIQVLDYIFYAGKIRAQTVREMDLHSKRGTIFDRHGEILAISVKTKSAYLSNKDAASALGVFSQVAQKISLSREERQRIAYRIRKGERFIWIKRKLRDEEFRLLSEMSFSDKEKGVLGFLDEYRRIYPQKRTACHILGGVGLDEQPLGGVELSLDGEIRGRGGKVRTLMDARKKVFHVRTIAEPAAGKDIVLTIDSALQFIVEKELQQTILKYQARGGAVVVLDSRDGSVLAMASYPDYSPEEIGHADPEALRNRATSFLYDPGSTFKIVTAASALENRASYPQQVFACHEGRYPVRDRVITDIHPYSQLSFQDIIVQSSNIGAARIGMKVGSERLYAMIKAFGFGRRTGIALPGEESGILNSLDKWTPEVSLAFISHGYEIAVTPLQMACAFNAYAANGYLDKPEIMKEIAGVPVEPAPRTRILSASTIQQMDMILIQVVERGTGTKARIAGLTVAGKTGTAQKMKGGEYSSDHISSFGGFFPAAEPQVTIFVMIDEPVGDYFGGDVAAPLFRAIGERILPQLGVFPLFSGAQGVGP